MNSPLGNPCCSIFRAAIFALALTAGPATHAQSLPPGADRETVIKTYGAPTSSVKGGAREILNYPQGRITLENGVVVKNTFKGEPDAPTAAVAQSAPESADSYLDIRASFKTRLIRKGPSPQPFENETPPPGVREVRYPSAGRNLKAWVVRPAKAPASAPVLVYFHGGFAFGADDLKDCNPFIAAGFVVMAPMLRGENGNPGDHERFLGEVDDARAALQWIAGQDYVDRNRIYTFGHSAGGVISVLTSLYDDGLIRRSGSSGGLYGAHSFKEMEGNPFDANNALECRMRTILGNVRDMKMPHVAYVGSGDAGQETKLARTETGKTGKLEVIALPGDHFSSLPPSIEKFLRLCLQDDKGG